MKLSHRPGIEVQTVLWTSDTATAAEVTQKEVELIIALRPNDPLVGYNRWPRFKG